MTELIEGHRFVLENFEVPTHGQTIQFIHKQPVEGSSTVLETVSDGTTNEEVLRCLIRRMNYLQGKFPCRENAIVLTNLETALLWLEKRTADRKARSVEGTNQK